MWTRAELKTQAKAGLNNYYWNGVLAIVVQGLVLSAAFPIMIIFPFGIPLMIIFATNAFEVGLCSYFIKSTRNGSDAGVGELFHSFSGEGYMSVVAVQFFRYLFIMLWSMLFVVPGIIKCYEYCMVPYLAAEYPQKSRKEIFQMSKQMMEGNKLNVLILDLSFIGWGLLGLLACCAGILFVEPYFLATRAELYLRLKEECFGIPREDVGGGNGFAGNGGQGGNYVAGQDGRLLGVVRSGYLVGIQGGFSGANIPIAFGEKLTIGRDPAQCNVVISGAQVSRKHLVIEFDGAAFRVTNLSASGTFDLEHGPLPMNQAVLLQSGTHLQIGNGGDIFKLECR